MEQVHDMVLEGYFADLTKNYYRDGIMALEQRWNKCIVLREIMLKNKNNFEIKNSFFLVLGRELFRPPSYIQNNCKCFSDGDTRLVT